MKDPCIRQLLKKTELIDFYGDINSKVVEELSLPIAGARIDIAVINGSLYGYEIKSASDNLLRLPSQMEAYLKVFDYISIATEEQHLEHVLEKLPEEIGVILCDEKGPRKITKIREPQLNSKKEAFYIAKLLWREEIFECLTKHQISFNKKDRNWLLCEALAANLNIDVLSEDVRETLKNRLNWKI
jgi:hypothetical protein